MGLDVPKTTIFKTDEMPLYAIQRYDRYKNNQGNIMRLVQEDFCQALNISPDLKYETHGGPSIAQCLKVINDETAIPSQNIARFMELVTFNMLIGNADAHGKNFSLLHDLNGTRLAPAYDLLCTNIYDYKRDERVKFKIETHMAMKIGTENRHLWARPRDFKQLVESANQAGVDIKYKTTIKLVQEMSNRMLKTINKTTEEYKDKHGDCQVVAEINKLIAMQAKTMVKEFSPQISMSM
jgi:serine/threonine-protein kinase HipA